MFLSVANWEEISQKLYDAEMYEDTLASEGESERGEVYTSDEVKRIIEADLKKYASHANPKKRTRKQEVA